MGTRARCTSSLFHKGSANTTSILVAPPTYLVCFLQPLMVSSQLPTRSEAMHRSIKLSSSAQPSAAAPCSGAGCGAAISALPVARFYCGDSLLLCNSKQRAAATLTVQNDSGAELVKIYTDRVTVCNGERPTPSAEPASTGSGLPGLKVSRRHRLQAPAPVQRSIHPRPWPFASTTLNITKSCFSCRVGRYGPSSQIHSDYGRKPAH